MAAEIPARQSQESRSRRPFNGQREAHRPIEIPTTMPPSKRPNPLFEGLPFEKKNKPAPLLPPNTKIQRRPLTHPPVASPYAGASVQKVVYVSRSTPIM